MKNIYLTVILSFLAFNIYSQSTERLLSKGISDIQNDDFNSALSFFNKVIEIENKNIKAYTLRGYTRGQLNDYVGAIQDFTKIISIEPNNSDAYDKRGICKKNNRDYQGALMDYNKAIKINNKNASAYCNRAVLKYDFLNNQAGACDDWEVSKSLGFELAYRNSEGKCEEVNGAIKTQKGLLIYFNTKGNYHTLNLDGDIDLSNFPFIKKDNNWFQFITNGKVNFFGENGNVLINFMNWEVNYLEQELKENLKVDNSIADIEGIRVNLWNYENPRLDNESIDTPVIKTYFADFVNNDLIYRFSYASTTGNNEIADDFLKSLVRNIRYYENKIDLNKLQQAISIGLNYYKE